MADAVCEAKGEPVTVAYVKDEDDKEVSMNDAASVEESKQRGPVYKKTLDVPEITNLLKVSKPAAVKDAKTGSIVELRGGLCLSLL